jgi:hypothetical protein
MIDKIDTEKPLQDKYIELLLSLGLPFAHIPNSAFGKGKIRAKYDSFGESCLKNFPDLDFQFNGKRYQRELGVPGRHSDRKLKQREKMSLYGKHGADIAIIQSEEEMINDWKAIGLIP